MITTTVAPDEFPSGLGGWVAEVGWTAWRLGYRLPTYPLRQRPGRTRAVGVDGRGPCSARYALILGARALVRGLTPRRRPCPARVSFRCPESLAGSGLADRISAGLTYYDGRTRPVPDGPRRIVTATLSLQTRARLEALGGNRSHWIIQALLRA